MSHKKYKLGNKVLKIKHHDSPESPREWDNLSRLIFIGKHKHMGDDHSFNHHDHYYESREDFMEQGAEHVRKYLKREEKLDVAYITPVHMYNHSGISLSTSYSGQHADRWDSGTCGFAVLTKQDIRKNWGIKVVSKNDKAKAIEILEGEIKVLNQYLSGDVYGYVLKEDGEEIDSCWGFYGDNPLENGMMDNIDDDEIEKWKEVIEAEY